MKLTRENYKAIKEGVRHVLLTSWDPIGVGDNPNLADEYDVYIPEILPYGAATNPQAAIFEALSRIENDLGMQVDENVRRQASLELAELLSNSRKAQ